MLPPSPYTLPDHGACFHIEGRGRPVVLLHGLMGATSPWRTLVERMCHSHRLIGIALAGDGGAPLPEAPGALTLQRQVARVESVLRVGLLPGERFHLVGHAQGAVVAWRIAQARPQRLHSLSLFERATLPDGGSRLVLPMCWLSDRPEAAHELEGFIRGVDALEVPLRTRVALHA
jgi:pimeloyl-ACP methyl ester carboxylesterase